MGSKDWAWVVVVAGAAWASVAVGGTAGAGPGDALCRVFSVSVEKELQIDTSDGTSEIGRWVAERRAQGWGSAAVDVDVVSRTSGTLAGYATVCVSR